jgi:hypothetical protein
MVKGPSHTGPVNGDRFKKDWYGLRVDQDRVVPISAGETL